MKSGHLAKMGSVDSPLNFPSKHDIWLCILMHLLVNIINWQLSQCHKQTKMYFLSFLVKSSGHPLPLAPQAL